MTYPKIDTVGSGTWMRTEWEFSCFEYVCTIVNKPLNEILEYIELFVIKGKSYFYTQRMYIWIMRTEWEF